MARSFIVEPERDKRRLLVNHINRTQEQVPESLGVNHDQRDPIAAAVNSIVENPHQSADRAREGHRWDHLREWASRAKAGLQREDELRERLGEGAPEMDAGQLRPWVWESAAAL